MTQADYARHDRITLTGITAKGYHGVLDFEKRDGQPFVVDVTLYSDFSAAAATDDLTKTTNYALVVDLIHRHVTNGSLDLIETLAVNIAEGILTMFELVEAVEITVSKPQAPIELPFGNV
ncbi:dihydroneopterin aldolase, partial [uncultured Rothia sp.]|uniref:dihydroneopterin aldolase n=1 Tax=uncultured Rothia sp. TaxID=316088 RepID=UPI00262CD7A9